MKDKTVIVTGGAKGIGESIARAFVDAGAIVYAVSRSQPNDFEERLPGARFIATDITERDRVHSTFKRIVDATGGIDVLVNNAGISEWKALEKIDETFLRRMLDTNLSGSIWCCQAAAEVMRSKGGGSIVNVASLAGKRGSKNNSVYCAAKFGLVGVTQALAKELGIYGIRVNSICPVYVPTEGLLSALSGDHPEVGDQNPEAFLQEWGSRNAALGRLPTGRECGEACLWLASASAGAVTGQNINVDCGVLPQ